MHTVLNLPALSLSFFFGLLLTIFYKKDFKFKKQLDYRRCRFLLILGSLWITTIFFSAAGLKTAISAVTLVYVLDEVSRLPVEEKVKCGVLGALRLSLPHLSEDNLVCLAVFCAFTQLLRWPLWLKEKLREIRIVFGPVYPLLVIEASVRSSFSSYLLTTAAVATLLASIFFRPDNKEMMRIVSWLFRLQNPSSRARKSCHGLLMVLSLLSIMMYCFACLSNINTIIYYATLAVGLLDITFYLFAAELPRNVFRELFYTN